MIALISIRNILRTRCWHGLLSYFTFNHSHIHLLSFFKCLTLSKYCFVLHSHLSYFCLLHSFAFFCVVECSRSSSPLAPAQSAHTFGGGQSACKPGVRTGLFHSPPKKNIWILTIFLKIGASHHPSMVCLVPSHLRRSQNIKIGRINRCQTPVFPK